MQFLIHQKKRKEKKKEMKIDNDLSLNVIRSSTHGILVGTPSLLIRAEIKT